MGEGTRVGGLAGVQAGGAEGLLTGGDAVAHRVELGVAANGRLDAAEGEIKARVFARCAG